MGFWVVVTLKDGKEISGPETDDKDGTERELEQVRSIIGKPETAGLSWFNVQGDDISDSVMIEGYE